MNYTKIYNDLIESRMPLMRSKRRGHFEKHHIIPKSLGGTNATSNLVLLTPREHYLAHWLLDKIHTGSDKAKMAYAFFKMCSVNPNQKRDITSHQFERAKEAIKKACLGENHPGHGKNPFSEEKIEAMRLSKLGANNPTFGKTPWNKGLTKENELIKQISEKTQETIKLRYLVHPSTGRKHSEESKTKMSLSMKGLTKSEDHRHKISKSLKGKARSPESILKSALSMTGVPQRTTICPHCKVNGGIPAMKRWHFDNCKQKPTL